MMVFIRYLLAVALALAPFPNVNAGWLPLVQSGGGGGSPTFTATDAQVLDGLPGSSTTQSWTVNLGSVVAADLPVIAVAGVSGGGAITISSITVNGSSAGITSVVTGADPNHAVKMFTVTGISGTSATVLVTVSSAFTSASIAVGVLKNLSSQTAGTTATTSYAGSQNAPYSMGSITVPTGGFGISVCWADSNAAIASSNTTIDTVNHAEGANTSIAMSHVGAGTVNPSFGTGPGNFANVVTLGAPWS